MFLVSRPLNAFQVHATRNMLGCIRESFKCHREFFAAFSCARWTLNCNAVVAGVVVVTTLLGCSGPSEPQPTLAQSQAASEEPARNDMEDKAWADASRAGTAAAITAYLEHHGSGSHAVQARQRLAALEEKARKDEERKAWADAFRAGTAAALNEYLQHHGSGAHAAEARQRLSVLERLGRWDEEKKAWADASRAGTAPAISEYLRHHGSGANAAEARQRLSVLENQARWDKEEKDRADLTRTEAAAATIEYAQHQSSGAHAADPGQRLSMLEEQPRKEVKTLRKRKPLAISLRSINIRETCRISVDLSGAAPGQRTDDACLKSEQLARDEIVKQWTDFLTAERALCINHKVYLPSYVEWLICLQMQTEVRKLRRQAASSKGDSGAGRWGTPATPIICVTRCSSGAPSRSRQSQNHRPSSPAAMHARATV